MSRRLWGRGIILALTAVFLLASPAFAADVSSSDDYRSFLGMDARVAVWIIAQLHLMFAAFVLGVPIFAVIVEVIGARTKDPAAAKRYDDLAHEFVKLLSTAFATTAALGGLLSFVLFSCYPGFMKHLTGIFGNTFHIYGLLFFAEAFTLYAYYYSWERLRGKWEKGVIKKTLLVIFSFLQITIIALIFVYMAGSSLASMFNFSIHSTSAYLVMGGGVLFAGVAFVWSCGGWLTSEKRALHIMLGLQLNTVGTVLMFIANSWATYMMSPPGVTPSGEVMPELWSPAGAYIGSLWEAVNNPLWMPMNIHRFIANICFGGFIVGAYAGVRFLTARSREEKAHYDWMGYIGNFVGIAALIPLPFAGYYLGREMYSASPLMGNVLMGGQFSWDFIIQAVLVGVLFVGGNYYLWIGMQRIPGHERYNWLIKFITVILFVCFAIWLTPHNLPLSGEERAGLGAGKSYHPFSSYFGIMEAKMAAVWFIILSTIVSFLMYRRAGKGDGEPFSKQGLFPKVAMIAVLLVSTGLLGLCATTLLSLSVDQLNQNIVPRENTELSLLAKEKDSLISENKDVPEELENRIHAIKAQKASQPLLSMSASDLGISEERFQKMRLIMLVPFCMLLIEIAALIAAVVLTFRDRGKTGQVVLLGVTVLGAVFLFGIYPYVIGVRGLLDSFLRYFSIFQFMMVISCILVVVCIDIFLFKGAREIGVISWGQISARSQYVLIILCVTIVLLMGLMGYIRSGVRLEWHVYGILKDNSVWAFTPSRTFMSKVVASIVVIFLCLVSFVFWLANLGEKKQSNQ